MLTSLTTQVCQNKGLCAFYGSQAKLQIDASSQLLLGLMPGC